MGMDFNETERVYSITENTELSYAVLSFPILPTVHVRPLYYR